MAKPSKQAERFWRAERARKVARSTPLGTIIEVRKAPPFVRLMKPGERCCVDDAIREALATGLLRGTLDEVRADLVVVCALAWGAAAWAYGARIAEPDIRKQKARVARLADDLAAVVDAMEAERVALEDLAADLGEAEDVTELSAIVEHGRALIPLLKRYATREESPEKYPPATNYLMRAFFDELGKWWDNHAINTSRRGAKAVRNRLAAGLWQDMRQEIPPGYSDDEFARRGFSLGTIER